MTDTELTRAVLVLTDDRPLFDGYTPTGLIDEPDIQLRPRGRHYRRRRPGATVGQVERAIVTLGDVLGGKGRR